MKQLCRKATSQLRRDTSQVPSMRAVRDVITSAFTLRRLLASGIKCSMDLVTSFSNLAGRLGSGGTRCLRREREDESCSATSRADVRSATSLQHSNQNKCHRMFTNSERKTKTSPLPVHKKRHYCNSHYELKEYKFLFLKKTITG